MEHSAEVQGDICAPLLLGDLSRDAEIVAPGVVDQYVEASVRVDRGSDCSPTIGGPGDIERTETHLPRKFGT